MAAWRGGLTLKSLLHCISAPLHSCTQHHGTTDPLHHGMVVPPHAPLYHGTMTSLHHGTMMSLHCGTMRSLQHGTIMSLWRSTIALRPSFLLAAPSQQWRMAMTPRQVKPISGKPSTPVINEPGSRTLQQPCKAFP